MISHQLYFLWAKNCHKMLRYYFRAIVVFAAISGLVFLQQSQALAQVPDSTGNKSAKSDQHIDRRIDNMGYWNGLARAGIIPRNPKTVPPPAKFAGTKIVNASIAANDSPDIPVTEISSSQSENSIFVSPVDGKTLANSNNSTNIPFSGYFLGADALTSEDEGENWQGQIEGAGGYNMGDPSVVINTEGRIFIGFIHHTGGQGIAFSDDTGTTWTTKIVAARPAVQGSFLDKNHLWIDLSDSSVYKDWLYDGWTVFGGADDGHVALNRSRQKGYGWLAPVRLSDSVMARSHNQGINISTGPDGQVYAVWSIYDDFPGDEAAIGYASSFNGGKTFNASKRIIDNTRGIRLKGSGKNMRVNSFPSMAVDISNSPWRGTIYVVFSNVNYPGINTGNDVDVYMIKSADSGKSWSVPVRINQDPQGFGKKHFFPWITCDPVTGNLAVVFYDDRNCGIKELETWVAASTNGGNDWQDFRVSDVCFTPLPVNGLADDYFGDYLGITSRNGMVYPCWTDNRSGVAMGYVSPFRLGPEPGNPYIAYVSNSIDDSASGNGNHRIDFGEEIELSLTLRNLGNVPDSLLTVTLIAENPDIRMIDSTEYVIAFAAGEMIEFADAFRFLVSDSVDNAEEIRIRIEVKDKNDSVFISYFTLKAYAPELSLKYFLIRNDNDADASLDPNEKAEVCITLENKSSFPTGNVRCNLTCINPFIVLQDTVISLPSVDTGGIAGICFPVEVLNADIGTVAIFDLKTRFSFQHSDFSIPKIIGQVTEDWETGTLKKFNWLLSGKKWWKLDSTYVHEGRYSVRSGKISDNDSTTLSLKYTALLNDTISFYYKVSSENNFDFLKFYIDDFMLGKWSGETDWTKVVFPVVPGKHTFIWKYQKDVAIKSGLDAAFVDLINLPSLLLTTVDLGPDRALCTGKTFGTNPSVTYFDSVYWLTKGTGYFEDPEDVKTTYHPSNADFESGETELILKVWGKSFPYFISDTLKISYIPNPYLNVNTDTFVCFYDSLKIQPVTAHDYQSVAWITSGDGFFNDTTLLEPVYFPGNHDIDTGNVMLIIRSYSDGVTTCGFSDDTINVSIIPDRDLGLPDEVIRCSGLGITFNVNKEDGDRFFWLPTGDTTNEISFDTASVQSYKALIAAIVTDMYGCVFNDSVNVSFKNCAEILRCGSISINLSPNPAKEKVNMQFYADEISDLNIAIFNAAGVAVFKAQTGDFKGYRSMEVDLRRYASGSYFVTFRTVNEDISAKLIIR